MKRGKRQPLIKLLHQIKSQWRVWLGAAALSAASGFAIGFDYRLSVVSIGILFFAISLIVNFVNSIAAMVTLVSAAALLTGSNLVPADFMFYLRFVPLAGLSLRAALQFYDKALSRAMLPMQMLSSLGLVSVLAFLSVLYSPQPMLSFQRAFTLALVVFGFGVGLASFVSRRRQLNTAIKVLGTMLLAGMVLNLAAGSFSSDFRFKGLYYSANAIGILGLMATVLQLRLYFKARSSVVRYLALAGLLFCFLLTVLSGSRAGLLGLLIAILVYGWLANRKKLVVVAGIAAVAVVMISMIAGQGIHLGGMMVVRPFADTSGRTAIWQEALGNMSQHPFSFVIGNGFGSSKEVVTLNKIGESIQLHSSPLSVLYELGFVGLAIVAFGLGQIVTGGVKSARARGGDTLSALLVAVIAGALFDSLFESWLLAMGSAETLIFWLLVSLLAIHNRLIRRKRKKRREVFSSGDSTGVVRDQVNNGNASDHRHRRSHHGQGWRGHLLS